MEARLSGTGGSPGKKHAGTGEAAMTGTGAEYIDSIRDGREGDDLRQQRRQPQLLDQMSQGRYRTGRRLDR